MKTEIRERIDKIKNKEIPQGYKKTKFGVIPESWKEISIDELVKEKKELCSNERVPLYSLTIEAGVVPKSERYEREHLVKDTESAYKYVQSNEFVYNPMNARFGAIARFKENNVVKVSKYYNVFEIKNIVNPVFFETLIKSKRALEYYDGISTGTLEEKKRVHFGEFIKISIPFPEKEEQEKIAEILAKWEERITKQEELIEKKKKYKKGMMQKIFSQKIRFKDENGNDYPEWEERPLGELGKTFNGLTGKNKDDFGNGKPYITYKSIFDSSKIEIKRVEYVTVLENENQNQVQKGDIFFTTSSETSTEVGMSSVLLDDVKECYLNSFCFGFRLNDISKILPNFMRFYLRSQKIRDEISKLAQGSTRYNLSKTELMKLILTIPSFPEQEKIADFLSKIDKEIELLEKEKEILKKEKQSLMSLLLNGIVKTV